MPPVDEVKAGRRCNAVMQVKRWTVKYYVYCEIRVVRISSNRKGMETEVRPSIVLKSDTSVGNLKGAPIPGALEALRQTADTGIRPLRLYRRLDWLCAGAAIAGAFAVAAAEAKVLPLAERAVAAIAGAMPLTLRVEACKLVKTNLLAGVLCAEDATALSAVVAAVEEAKWCLTRGRRACCSGAIRLERFVSTVGLERFATVMEGPMGSIYSKPRLQRGERGPAAVAASSVG